MSVIESSAGKSGLVSCWEYSKRRYGFDSVDWSSSTGDILKPVVWGTTKADAVRHFCDDNDVAVQRSYFYADGDEDTASMSMVGYPRSVNPRSGLAAAAAAHGWPVMCLASGRPRRPVWALRYLAKHVRRDKG
jgi:phosphoserine phosphatase